MSIGIFTSAPPPGAPSTAASSMASISKKAAASSVAVASSGVHTVSTSANGPMKPTTPHPVNTNRWATNSMPATPTASDSSSATTAGCPSVPAPSASKAPDWVETGDNGDIEDQLARPCSPAWARKVSGYPADFHVRDFLDCVKSRGQTRANADVACWAHIACHAANVALFLGRKVKYDPVRTCSSGTRKPIASAPKPCAIPGPLETTPSLPHRSHSPTPPDAHEILDPPTAPLCQPWSPHNLARFKPSPFRTRSAR
jgi:hypothetical protein